MNFSVSTEEEKTETLSCNKNNSRLSLEISSTMSKFESKKNENIVKVWPISLNKEYEANYDDFILNADGNFSSLYNLFLDCNDNHGYHYYVLNANPMDFNIRVTPK